MNIFIINNISGLINGSDGNFNVSCENPQETKLTTSKLEPLRTSPYIISSVGNNDNDDVITTTSHVTNNPTDSTLKESSNINQEKQICNSVFFYSINFKHHLFIGCNVK